MNPRLLEAASTGNVTVLLNLIQENSNILIHNVTLDSWDTALHIASLFGHVEFVRTVLQYNPEPYRKLNRQDQSPLHLASANGHLEIVKIFLARDTDSSLCCLKDKDGMVPLHLAAMRGEVQVLIELFRSCPQLVTECTNGNDAVLFLVVKNNQYKALEALINEIRMFNPDDNEIYNVKDEEGNTILHHACKEKRWKMVKLLKSETNMNINLVNSKGLTPLDIVIRGYGPQSSIKEEIERLLKEAGGKRAFVDSNSIAAKTEKVIDSLKTGILIMASTFIALTFEMALNPPGGFWSEYAPDYDRNRTFPLPPNVKFSPSNLVFIPVKLWSIRVTYIPKVPSGGEHRPGKAINREMDRVSFFAFLLYNAVIFMISIVMIFMVAVFEILPVGKSLAAGFLFLLMLSLVVFAGLLYRSGVALATDMQVSQWVVYGALYNIAVGISIYLFILLLILGGKYVWSFYKKKIKRD